APVAVASGRQYVSARLHLGAHGAVLLQQLCRLPEHDGDRGAGLERRGLLLCPTRLRGETLLVCRDPGHPDGAGPVPHHPPLRDVLEIWAVQHLCRDRHSGPGQRLRPLYDDAVFQNRAERAARGGDHRWGGGPAHLRPRPPTRGTPRDRHARAAHVPAELGSAPVAAHHRSQPGYAHAAGWPGFHRPAGTNPERNDGRHRRRCDPRDRGLPPGPTPLYCGHCRGRRQTIGHVTVQGWRFAAPPALGQQVWSRLPLGGFVLAAQAARADTHAARRAVHVDGGVVQVGLEAPRGLGRAAFPLAAVVVADVAPERRTLAALVTFSRHSLFSLLDSYALVIYQLS